MIYLPCWAAIFGAAGISRRTTGVGLRTTLKLTRISGRLNLLPFQIEIYGFAGIGDCDDKCRLLIILHRQKLVMANLTKAIPSRDTNLSEGRHAHLFVSRRRSHLEFAVNHICRFRTRSRLKKSDLPFFQGRTIPAHRSRNRNFSVSLRTTSQAESQSQYGEGSSRCERRFHLN